MKKATNIIKSTTLLGVILLSSCTSLSLREKRTSTPLWVQNHPISRTHFIGIGSAKIDKDLYAAQKLARNRALQDISEQIQISIVSDVSTYANCKTVNNKLFTNETYKERIAAFSNAVLTDWEEKNTFQGSNGYFWSKVVLSKKRYYERVNEKITNAIEHTCDIIRNAGQGTAKFRIFELYKGFEIIDEFFGTPLYGRIKGRQVLLNNELERCMAKLLESIEIKPAIQQVRISATESAPQTLGVYVFIEGEIDKSLDISWSASKGNVGLKSYAIRQDGMHPVLITSLPASSGNVTITATPDLKSLAYDLIRRKFTLPAGSFTVNRDRAQVFIDNKNGFCWSLAEKLADRSAISIVYSRKDAEFILTSDFTKGSDATLKKSIYLGDGHLYISLLAKNGNPVFEYNQTIQATDGISSTRALDNTQEYALEVAVKQVERVF